ncbi:MAG TPA: tRNA (adenosine(37)-N6)-threonylcarbamoyltransferase complex transferase subunit TsaD [Candidatus Paceibacterota bacterium]
MTILSIETSCDETAITVLEASGDEHAAEFRILGNALLSQIDIHREFGGVYPAVAKREHAKNLVPILAASLEEAGMLREASADIPEELRTELASILEREPGLSDALLAFLGAYGVPDIDAIAVTHGPGLEPALWVGVNFAKALSIAWQKPVTGINHMEGHLLSALAVASEDDASRFSIADTELPVLALLISGGHTELVSMDSWLSYKLIGRTRDDAVGEAFDKVARMLGLPYPGGPEVSKLAEAARDRNNSEQPQLPRPMLGDGTCDFSFSGLKTAVLYLVKGRELSEKDKEEVAHAFEDAVGDVLFGKASRALVQTRAKTLVLGGGVSANTHVKRVFAERMTKEHPEVALRIPAFRFTTDNAIMIGIAGYYRALRQDFLDPHTLRADGNLSLT